MSDHLAILKPVYLRLIVEGVKTIECRLTRTPKPPFKSIAKGEQIYLKESSGLVLAVGQVEKVVYRQINDPKDLETIRWEYGEEIMAQEQFWQSRRECRYCTLIFLENVRALAEPFRIDKRDMRSWVVLDGKQGFNWPENAS
ncbi:MAG: ASCH domain-containing protein [Actinobacteria bacterium]|nr:ASCH domain-containing protein [Actinomycetota bacterium]